jgi:hypothetical protein
VPSIVLKYQFNELIWNLINIRFKLIQVKKIKNINLIHPIKIKNMVGRHCK